MELTFRDRKRIKNGLPGFADGNMGWQTPPQYYPESLGHINMPPAQGITPTGQNLGITNNIDINKLQQAKPELTGIKTPNPGINYGAIPMAIPAVIGAASDIVDAHSYSKSSENLLQESGTRQATAGGVGFEWQNDPEYQRELEEVRKSNTANALKSTGSGVAAGAAIGSIVPGLGTLAGGAIGGAIGLVGGLFGGASRKRKAKEALRQAEINAKVRNDFAMDDALTRSIRQSNAEEIGNPFANAYKYEDGKRPIATAFGLSGLKMNSKVSPGEWIVEPGVSAFKVPGGHYKNGKPNTSDSFGALVGANTAVLSNHGAAQYYDKTMDLDGALYLDQLHRMNKHGYKNGKLPGFEGGLSPWTNIIPSAFGGIASIYQYFDAKNQNIKSPNVYASNPYAQDAFAAMNEIKNNPYPTLQQLRDAEARTKYALDQAGGLGSGQKMLARIAQQGLTQNAWAKSLADTQAYNNAQKMAVQNAKLQTGYQDATRRQQANAFNEEYTAKSHAARQQGMQMGIYNFLNQLQGYYANEFKRRQFNDTMDLYRQQQDLDKAQFNAWMNRYNKSKQTATVRAPLSTTTINKLGGLQNPYASRMYVDDLLKRAAAFRPTLIR